MAARYKYQGVEYKSLMKMAEALNMSKLEVGRVRRAYVLCDGLVPLSEAKMAEIRRPLESLTEHAKYWRRFDG